MAEAATCTLRPERTLFKAVAAVNKHPDAPLELRLNLEGGSVVLWQHVVP